MKREKQIKYIHEIYSSFPLFFVECCKCEKEFRWERGWRALTGPFHGGNGRWRYVCKSCVPTKQGAHKHFHNYSNDIPKKPQLMTQSPIQESEKKV